VSTPFGVRGLDVVDGEHLLLAPPSAFAGAIRATIDDPAAAHRRAAAGRALAVERYDWQPLGARLWTMVRDILAARNTSPGLIGEVV
jgi:glycosyltransferase involved in cell wall biosynthesis